MKYSLIIKNMLVLFSLIAMIWLFYLQNQTPISEGKKTKPQEYMSFLTIINYNATGNPKEKLQADYWEFIPNHGRSDLQKPYVTVYKDNGNVWHLSADKALAWHPTIGGKITELDMQDNVVIERTAENNATPTKVTTQSMQYFPGKAIITSDGLVKMHQPGLLISGYGMLGHLENNRIELHENITTVYKQIDS